MTLEQQVANLVSATTDLTSVVNTELNNVRQENTNFKNGITDSQGQGIFNGIKVGRGAGNISSNTATGTNPLINNTTGQYNSAFGYSSLRENTIGQYNSAFGYTSLYYNTTGQSNSAFGHASLLENTTGQYNSAFGHASLYYNTTGQSNSAFGHASLYYNTTGQYNSAFGYTSLRDNTTGKSNSAFGHASLRENTIGEYNSAFGHASLYYNTTGQYNSAFGYASLSLLVDFSNCVGVGFDAQVTGSNQVQVGNSSTNTYVYGTVQSRSDVRDKTDIRNTILGLDFIKSLRPVDYRWDMREDYKPVAPQDPGMEATEEQKVSYQTELKVWLEACKLKNIVHNGTKKRNRFHHGLIAQEVKAILTQKGIDFGGYQDHSISGGDDVLSLGYDQFIAPLIKAVQELSAQNEALIARISALESNLK
jgi:Chaperone of endosialidase